MPVEIVEALRVAVEQSGLVALLLEASLGGVVEAVVGEKLSRGAEKRAAELTEQLASQPVDERQEAVKAALEAAIEEVAEILAEDNPGIADELQSALSEELTARQVVARLLGAELPTAVAAAGGSEGATEIGQALELLHIAVERRLLADSRTTNLVQGARTLALLRGLEGYGAAVAGAMDGAVAQLGALTELGQEGNRLAAAGNHSLESIDGKLDGLVELVGIRDQVERIAQAVERGVAAGAMAALPGGVGLTEEEVEYLRKLRQECDRVPLAEDSRSQSSDRKRAASLAKIYVDLATTEPASWELAMDRLGVPAERRGALETELREWLEEQSESSAQKEERAKPGLPSTDELRALLGWVEKEELGQKSTGAHPLSDWASSAVELRPALEPLSALEAFGRKRHLVLLGDPGSGKSTFVNHLAHTLAGGVLEEAGRLEQPSGWRATLSAWQGASLFPVRIALRRWSELLDEEAEGEELLYRAVEQLLGHSDRERWRERFRRPDTLVLFDGLDEVPAGTESAAAAADGVVADRRRRVLEAVEAFCTVHEECRVLVTCRVKPYEKRGYRLAGRPVYRLAPLDSPRIHRFSENWYEELVAIGDLAWRRRGERASRAPDEGGRRAAGAGADGPDAAPPHHVGAGERAFGAAGGPGRALRAMRGAAPLGMGEEEGPERRGGEPSTVSWWRRRRTCSARTSRPYSGG